MICGSMALPLLATWTATDQYIGRVWVGPGVERVEGTAVEPIVDGEVPDWVQPVVKKKNARTMIPAKSIFLSIQEMQPAGI
jgi:hypothetical protein